MSWLKKEAKALTKEFARQSCILVFGSATKPHSSNEKKKVPGAVKQYNKAQAWAKRNGFK